MSLLRPIWNSSRGLVFCRVLIMCIAVLSLLSVRIAPPSLPQISTGLTVNLPADHDHRPCFDHEDSRWQTTPIFALNAPLPAVSPHPTDGVEPAFEIAIAGWHYNRPPATS
jgi:hypothetical protein